MRISILRRLEFDAAHRVMNHESKCATIHGHRYVVEVEAEPKPGVGYYAGLDQIGRVVDFSVIKLLLGEWIDREWDHTAIIYQEDSKTIEGLNMCPSFKPICIVGFNPTAENMARYLLEEVCPGLFKTIVVTAVTIWETPNCKATARLF